MTVGNQAPISKASGYEGDMHGLPSPDRSPDRKQWKGVTPSSATTMLCSSRQGESSRSFSDGMMWERLDSPPHIDIIRQLREQQSRCSADVAALEARLSSCEKKILAATERVAQVAVAGQIPIVVCEQQQMRRVAAARPAASNRGTRAESDAVEAFRKDFGEIEEKRSQEVSALSSRVRDLAEQQNSLTAKFEATPDVSALSRRLADVEAIQNTAAARLDVLSELPSLSKRLADLEVLQSDSQTKLEVPVEVSALSKRLADLETLHSTMAISVDAPQDGPAFAQKLQNLEESHNDAVTKLDAALDAARTGIARLARELHWEKEERKRVLSDVNALAKDLGNRVVGPTLDKVAKELRSEMNTVIGLESAKLQRAIDSRVQLVIAELRGGTEAGVGLEISPINLSANTVCGRSLKEWLPENADGDVESTKSMLMHLRVFEHMAVGGSTPDDLVSRPTTRFLHRVVVAIKHATGYPQGILEDWPGPAEAKVDFVRKVWDSVATTLGLQGMEFNAQDVLRCTNRKQTRRLLQLLAIAASKERGWLRRMPGIQMSTPTGCNEVALPSSTVPVAAHSEVASSESNVATSACWH
mmetsp:Transcript_138467/g.359853  ORF Transcript_138467/g.359853 Transcript_138467/m.359853 type:complete len:587 (-) Transcript_138467:325-2085(-)